MEDQVYSRKQIGDVFTDMQVIGGQWTRFWSVFGDIISQIVF
jgi:hypothetical protein